MHDLDEIIQQLEHAHSKIAKSGDWEMQLNRIQIQINRLHELNGDTEQTWCSECEEEVTMEWDEDGKYCSSCGKHVGVKSTEVDPLY